MDILTIIISGIGGIAGGFGIAKTIEKKQYFQFDQKR
jgi:uncharacterized protein YneF (UPF0154 family)